MKQVSSSEARAALHIAQTANARTRRPARWAATYIAVFGAGFAVMTLLLGLTELNRNSPAVLPSLWMVLMVAMGIWSARQRATLAGIGRRVAMYFIGAGVLYATVLVVGINRFHGKAGYWIVAAIVVSAPMLAGAWRESRA